MLKNRTLPKHAGKRPWDPEAENSKGREMAAAGLPRHPGNMHPENAIVESAQLPRHECSEINQESNQDEGFSDYPIWWVPWVGREVYLWWREFVDDKEESNCHL